MHGVNGRGAGVGHGEVVVAQARDAELLGHIGKHQGVDPSAAGVVARYGAGGNHKTHTAGDVHVVASGEEFEVAKGAGGVFDGDVEVAQGDRRGEVALVDRECLQGRGVAARDRLHEGEVHGHRAQALALVDDRGPPAGDVVDQG